MIRLAQEKNPEILRQAAVLLERENGRLANKIAELTKENAALKGEDPSTLQLRLVQLEQELAHKNHMLFGASSEKRPDTSKEPTEREKKPRKGHGPRPQLELPITVVVHDLDEADKVCAACGDPLDEWEGQFEESVEVDVLPRRFEVKRHLRKKYRCRCGGCIETAPGPLKLCEGARYSIDFAIEVATCKYLEHAPLERQVRCMQREGLCIDSQTLWDQIERLAGLLEPSYHRMRHFILSHAVVGADETRWRIMGKDGKPEGGSKWWQIWLVQCPHAVFYTIEDSRSTDAGHALLQGYTGTVMCDGYVVYKALQNAGALFTLAHGMAHARREFVKIEASFPHQVAEVLQLIGELYAVEDACPRGTEGDELRRTLRHEKSRPLMARIQAWMWETWSKTPPNSGLRAAIQYMAGIWNGLLRFLDDPHIPIDNNASERAARGPVVGRKNFYGSRSKRGTQVAALFYTLLESAKLAGVEPKAYLRIATIAALRHETIPLPHELAAATAAGSAA